MPPGCTVMFPDVMSMGAAPIGAPVRVIVSLSVKPAPAIVMLVPGFPLGGLMVMVAYPLPSPMSVITPKPKGTLIVSLPLMPRMLSGYGPGNVPAPTLIVTVALLEKPGDAVTVFDGENTALAPTGKPSILSVTVLLVVPTDSTVTVALPDAP